MPSIFGCFRKSRVQDDNWLEPDQHLESLTAKLRSTKEQCEILAQNISQREQMERDFVAKFPTKAALDEFLDKELLNHPDKPKTTQLLDFTSVIFDHEDADDTFYLHKTKVPYHSGLFYFERSKFTERLKQHMPQGVKLSYVESMVGTIGDLKRISCENNGPFGRGFVCHMETIYKIGSSICAINENLAEGSQTNNQSKYRACHSK